MPTVFMAKKLFNDNNYLTNYNIPINNVYSLHDKDRLWPLEERQTQSLYLLGLLRCLPDLVVLDSHSLAGTSAGMTLLNLGVLWALLVVYVGVWCLSLDYTSWVCILLSDIASAVVLRSGVTSHALLCFGVSSWLLLHGSSMCVSWSHGLISAKLLRCLCYVRVVYHLWSPLHIHLCQLCHIPCFQIWFRVYMGGFLQNLPLLGVLGP